MAAKKPPGRPRRGWCGHDPARSPNSGSGRGLVRGAGRRSAMHAAVSPATPSAAGLPPCVNYRNSTSRMRSPVVDTRTSNRAGRSTSM